MALTNFSYRVDALRSKENFEITSGSILIVVNLIALFKTVNKVGAQIGIMVF